MDTMTGTCLFFVVFLKSGFLASNGYVLSSFHLVYGSTPNEGRVEVTLRDDDDDGDELQGVVASDASWTKDAANWVCEELGYRHAAFLPDDNRFGRGMQSQIFSLDNQTIVDPECDSDDSNNCNEIEAAGVACQKPGYLGCFRIRSMELSERTVSETNQVRTNDDCLGICRNLTAPFAAQKDDVCYCLNGFSTSFLERVCNTRCSRNPEQFCGRNQKDSYIVFNASVGFCPEITGVNLNVYGRYRFGDIVRANCSGRFRLMGDDVLQCVGGPDFFEWNGTVPTCIDGTTVQPRTTNGATTEPIRGTLTPLGHTMAWIETSPDATTKEIISMRRDSISTAVQVAVSVVGVVIVAVLALLLVLFVIRTRKTRSKGKPDECKSNDISGAIPNDEGPSLYYEVGQNAVFKCNNGLIDNVLYKPADDVRKNTNEYELDQDALQDAPHYGLIDNVLYKPVESTGDVHSNDYEVFEVGSDGHGDSLRNDYASDSVRQIPKGFDLPSNDPEYSSLEEHECSNGHQEGELIDNALYTTADNQGQNGPRKYHDIKPDPDVGHYAEVESSPPPPDSGPRYYVITPQTSDSPPPSNGGVNDVGQDTTDLATAEGPRFKDRTENTPCSLHKYATVNKGSNGALGSSHGSDSVKQELFPCYASVKK